MTSFAGSPRCVRSTAAAFRRPRSPSGATSIAVRPSPPCGSRSCQAPRTPLAGRRPPSPHEAVVRLERVSYAYPGRALPVISDADLELHPGEVVGLVGPTGSGKSTVAAVLLGFAEPRSGRVTVAGA